jgi:hypothetical protein
MTSALASPPDEVPVLAVNLEVAMAVAGQGAPEVDVEDADGAVGSNAVRPHGLRDILVQSDGIVNSGGAVIADMLADGSLL